MQKQNNAMKKIKATQTYIDKIDLVYKDDLDIVDINNKILFNLEWKQNVRRKQILLDLDEISKKCSSKRSILDLKEMRYKKTILDNELKFIDSGKEKEHYISKSSSLLKSYTDLGPSIKVVSFVSGNKVITIKNSQERHQIINSFILIARQFINLNVTKEGNGEKVCECGETLKTLELNESGVYQCSNSDCNISHVVSLKNGSITESSKNTNSNRNNYEDRENFKKTLDRYQGKQILKGKDALFEKLDKWCKSYSFMSGEEIRSLPCDENGRKYRTSTQTMYSILSEIGCTSYYEDVYLICHLYWGWKLQDISDIEDKIMADYDDVHEIIAEIDFERKSCLNSQYMLFRLIQVYIPSISSDDFKIIKTRDILETYEHVWRIVCEEKDWPFKTII